VIQLYIDADACPVKDEIYRVAARHGLPVSVVAGQFIRTPQDPLIERVAAGSAMDAADDWIAERITQADVCVTSDIPLAARCLAKAARAVSPTGRHWTQDNIGNALAGRGVARHMREIGLTTGGPAPLTRADRSRFLGALDAAVQAALANGR
jgi:uncharacterized protein